MRKRFECAKVESEEVKETSEEEEEREEEEREEKVGREGGTDSKKKKSLRHWRTPCDLIGWSNIDQPKAGKLTSSLHTLSSQRPFYRCLFGVIDSLLYSFHLFICIDKYIWFSLNGISHRQTRKIREAVNS